MFSPKATGLSADDADSDSHGHGHSRDETPHTEPGSMFRDTYADDESDSPGCSSSFRLGTATNNTTTATAQKELFPSPTAGPAVDFFHAPPGERNLDIIPEDDTSVQAEAGSNPGAAIRLPRRPAPESDTAAAARHARS